MYQDRYWTTLIQTTKNKDLVMEDLDRLEAETGYSRSRVIGMAIEIVATNPKAVEKLKEIGGRIYGEKGRFNR